MRRLFISLALFVSAAFASAQVSISASHVSDAFSRQLQAGKLCFQPVDATGKPTGFRSGTYQVQPTPVCGLISNGALQAGLSVLANPSGVYFHIWTATPQNVVIRDYGMTDVTGTSWSFDAYDPNTASVPVTLATVGTVTTLAAGQPAAATITQGTNGPLLNVSIPQGVQGVQGLTGNTGATGAAATVAVGTTSTGAAGTSAAVTNSGTSSAAVLNFTVPQGVPGIGADATCHTDGSGNLVGCTSVAAQQFTGAASPLTADATCSTGQYWIAPVTGTTNAWRKCENGVRTNVTLTGQHSWTTFTALGDSITFGTGATVAANNYVSRLASAVGAGYADNQGVGGSMACDVAKNKVFGLYNPGDQGNPLFTFLIGTNEGTYKGAGSYEAVSTLCRRAVETWLATSSTNKYTGGSFGTPPTNWTTDLTYSTNLVGIQSTTNGAVSSWPITTMGGPILVWYRIIDGDAGTFTYAVDGGTAVTVNGFTSPAIATQNGVTSAVGVAVITGASGSNAAPVSHTVTITVTSATGASNVVSILAVGTTPPTNAKNPSSVFVGGTPYEKLDVASASTAAYNADAQSDVTFLAPLGVNLTFVDVRQFLGASAVEMFDLLHPNDLGHQHLFNAFYSAIQPTGGAPANTSFPAIVPTAGSTYTPTLNDGVIFMSGGTLPLPQTRSVPKTYFVINYSATASVSVTSPNGGDAGTVIMPNSGAVFVSSGNGTWWIVRNGLRKFRAVTGSTSLTLDDEVVYQNGGGTITLGSASRAGVTIDLVNYDTTNSVTLSGGLMSMPSKTLLPLQGVRLLNYDGVNWTAESLGSSSFVPTLTGFGTGASVSFTNGLENIVLNVGTGGTAATGTVTLPPAPHGWNCRANDVTTTSATVFVTKQTASTTTSATFGNFNTSGTSAAWNASDILNVGCRLY